MNSKNLENTSNFEGWGLTLFTYKELHLRNFLFTYYLLTIYLLLTSLTSLKSLQISQKTVFAQVLSGSILYYDLCKKLKDGFKNDHISNRGDHEREILLCHIANLHIPKNLENAPAQL